MQAVARNLRVEIFASWLSKDRRFQARYYDDDDSALTVNNLQPLHSQFARFVDLPPTYITVQDIETLMALAKQVSPSFLIP